MFLKPFKIKSHAAIKGSDRKKLKSDINQQFPHITPEDLSSLIPSKADVTVMKLSTHSGVHLIAFFLNKNPIFFQDEKILIPTVYTLWKIPDLLPVFTTVAPVLEKLNSGADLMLPGIVTNGEWNPKIFGQLNKGDICSVNLTENQSAIAVGRTAMSSEDMFLSGKRGKGVFILHTYLDQLWAAGEKLNVPLVVSKEVQIDVSEDLEEQLEKVTLEEEKSEKPEEELSGNETVQIEENEKSPVEKMDELLLKCFLHSWKTTAKKVELPLLISSFYRLHMVENCPKGLILDVKKSSYKKLSKFIHEMQERGFIHVKELSKGVESIVEVNLMHPEIREYVVEEVEECDDEVVESVSPSKMSYVFPEVTELFVVVADVLPVFKFCGVNKGETLNVAEIRKKIKEYITANELQNIEVRSMVNLDGNLAQILKTNEIALKWDVLMTRVLERMKPAYEIKFPNQPPIVKKGKLELIELSIAQRAANKKVTLINNLEVYNIDPNSFAHSVQIGVAASTCVNSAPNRKEGHEVLVQGNQIKFIAKLLLQDYQVPKRFIRGLELAPKKK